MFRMAWNAWMRRRSSNVSVNWQIIFPTRREPIAAPVPVRRRSAPAAPQSTAKPVSNHRGRMLAMRVEHSRLFSARRCQRLEALGVITLGDLAYGDLRAIAIQFGAPARAYRELKRYRRAIRLAASLPGLTPPDALFLVSVHRRSPHSIAMQTAASLRRDLLRFAESSDGQSTLRGRPVPSIRRIKRWIVGAEGIAAAA